MDNWIIKIGHFSGPTIDERGFIVKADAIYNAMTIAESMISTDEVIYSIQREDTIE